MLKLIVSADIPQPIELRRHVANQQAQTSPPISSQAGLASLRRGALLARSLNQPIVGIGSPAGDSGTSDRGTVGTAAPVESAPRVHHTAQTRVGGDAA